MVCLHINTAGNGTNSWVTGGLGTTQYANGERSFVESQCYNLSNLNYPVLKMKGYWNTQDEDGANIEYSSDQGNSWNSIGEMGEPGNWYNSTPSSLSYTSAIDGWFGDYLNIGSNGWRDLSHAIPGLSTEDTVIFRINFAS